MSNKAPGPVSVLRGHSHPVNCISIYSNTILISGDSSGVMKLWNLGLKRAFYSNTVHLNSILSISNTFSAKSIVTFSRDGTAKYWSLSTGSVEAVRSFETNAMHFCNASMDKTCQDENLLVTPSGNENEVLLWDMRAENIATRFLLPSSHGMTSSLSLYSTGSSESDSNGSRNNNLDGTATTSTTSGVKVSGNCNNSGGSIFVGLEDGSLSSLDLRSNRNPQCNVRLHSQPVLCHDSFGPASNLLIASGGADESICLSSFTDVSGSSCVSSVPCNSSLSSLDSKVTLPNPGVSSLRFRNDGRLLLSGHWDGSARLWQVKRCKSGKSARNDQQADGRKIELKPLAILRYHRESVFGVDFCPSNRESSDNGSGDPSSEFQSNDGSKTGLSAGMFATSSKDGSIALWDVYANNTNTA